MDYIEQRWIASTVRGEGIRVNLSINTSPAILRSRSGPIRSSCTQIRETQRLVSPGNSRRRSIYHFEAHTPPATSPHPECVSSFLGRVPCVCPSSLFACASRPPRVALPVSFDSIPGLLRLWHVQDSYFVMSWWRPVRPCSVDELLISTDSRATFFAPRLVSFSKPVMGS